MFFRESVNLSDSIRYLVEVPLDVTGCKKIIVIFYGPLLVLSPSNPFNSGFRGFHHNLVLLRLSDSARLLVFCNGSF
jgi:hypothetical protein